MKVSEIIKELQECPQEDEVTVEFQEITRIAIWPDGVVIETKE